MKKFALSFKGGAARGFGGIGIMRFFQEENLKPSLLAGSSAGGIIAAAYSLGYNWKEVLNLISSIRLRKLVSLKSIIKEGSLISKDNYEKVLKKFHKDLDLEDLPIPTILFATDLRTNERIIIKKGSLINSLIASSSFPPIFPQVAIPGYKKSQIVDGDFTLGYSAKELRNQGVDKVIGISFKNSEYYKKPFYNFIDRILVSNALLFNVIDSLNNDQDPVDYDLRYEIGNYSATNFKDIEKIAEKAYHTIKRHKSEVLELLS